MKKRLLILLMAVVMLAMFLNATPVLANNTNTPEPEKQIQFTEDQKKVLADLYKEIFELRKTVVDKYVEFGAMSKETAEKAKSWMDEHYQRMEERGFQPMEHRHHHGHEKARSPKPKEGENQE